MHTTVTILFFSLAQCLVDLYELTTQNLHLYAKKIEEKNSVKPVLAGLEMKAQAGQKIGQ